MAGNDGSGPSERSPRATLIFGRVPIPLFFRQAFDFVSRIAQYPVKNTTAGIFAIGITSFSQQNHLLRELKRALDVFVAGFSHSTFSGIPKNGSD
jgi:hypothetical protein